MNATMVSRLISLIPDRSPRAQSGSVFSSSEAATCRYPERIAYLTRFLHWLGPLDPMTREDQQILGVRSSGGRPMAAGETGELGEEAGEELELDEMGIDDGDDGPLPDEALGLRDTGTPIAPTSVPSTVGG
jgi:hypothetical protein